MSKSNPNESKYLKSIEENVRTCDAMRLDSKEPVDVSFAEFIKERYQCSMEDYYQDLGVNPQNMTIQNIISMPDSNMRWLLPEIFRDALRLGLRKAPIYPNVIASEQSVSQLSLTMPQINMSDAAPKKVGIAETIKVGDVSFGSKTVKIHKMGRGIKIPYELRQYVSLNIVSIFLEDFGVKLGMGLDSMLIDTLTNGDQEDGSDSAPVIGVQTVYNGSATDPSTTGVQYIDYLRLWVRMSRLGKNPGVMIAGEDMAVQTLNMKEFKRAFGDKVLASINVKTPLPTTSDMFVHSAIPDDQILILDKSNTIIKLNAQPLLVESEKIVSNQTEATYATLTTGFANLFRDSRIVMDQTKDFSTNGFPTWMDPSTAESVTID